MKRLLMCVLMVGLLVGCQASSPQYATYMHQAHQALRDARPERAQQQLLKAKEVAAEENLGESADCRLLEAETRLAQGDLAGALSTARAIMAEETGYPQSAPRAEEIIGKVMLRSGRFSQAQEHFVAAERQYEAEQDRRQAMDLTLLARGLVVYSDGDIDVANKYWRSIADPSLRHSLDRVRQSVNASEITQ